MGMVGGIYSSFSYCPPGSKLTRHCAMLLESELTTESMPAKTSSIRTGAYLRVCEEHEFFPISIRVASDAAARSTARVIQTH